MNTLSKNYNACCDLLCEDKRNRTTGQSAFTRYQSRRLSYGRPKQFKGPYLMHTRHVVQESLANAKVSARHQRVYEGRPLAKKSTAIRQINARNKVEKVDKYIQWVSTLSLTWVYLHLLSSCCNVASKICEILRNSPKIQTNRQTPLQHNSLTENTV